MAFSVRCTDCWREDKADPTRIFIDGVEIVQNKYEMNGRVYQKVDSVLTPDLFY
jgi:hypothetical protein